MLIIKTFLYSFQNKYGKYKTKAIVFYEFQNKSGKHKSNEALYFESKH